MYKKPEDIKPSEFTGQFKEGDKVRVKDIPGWKDQYSDSFRFSGAEGKVIEVRSEPGEDYKIYSVQLPRHGYVIVTFTEDLLESV